MKEQWIFRDLDVSGYNKDLLAEVVRVLAKGDSAFIKRVGRTDESLHTFFNLLYSLVIGHRTRTPMLVSFNPKHYRDQLWTVSGGLQMKPLRFFVEWLSNNGYVAFELGSYLTGAVSRVSAHQTLFVALHQNDLLARLHAGAVCTGAGKVIHKEDGYRKEKGESRELCRINKMIRDHSIGYIDNYSLFLGPPPNPAPQTGVVEEKQSKRIDAKFPIVWLPYGELCYWQIVKAERRPAGSKGRPRILGGRIYCHAQNLHTNHRNNLRIDGEPVVTLDIKACHLAFAYSLVGQNLPPGDPYGGFVSNIDGKPFKRDLAKIAVQCWLNTDTLTKAELAVSSNTGLSRHIAKDLLSQIATKHCAIANVVDGASFCLNAQAWEGAMALRVLQAILSEGIGVINIHDGYVVPAMHVNKCKAIIQDIIGPQYSLEIK